MVGSNRTRKARLTQYRKNAGRWQFYAGARNNDGKPIPENIVIAGQVELRPLHREINRDDEQNEKGNAQLQVQDGAALPQLESSPMAHSFSPQMLQPGLDIRSLQLLLGHKNLSTTEKYVKSLCLG